MHRSTALEKKKEIPVGVSGAKGHMGRITAAGLEDCKSTELVFKTDLHDDLEQAIRETGARVVVDFTTPEAVFENTLSIIAAGAVVTKGTVVKSGSVYACSPAKKINNFQNIV